MHLCRLLQCDTAYREIVAFATDGILIGTPQAIICEANDAVCTLFGVPRESLIGSRIQDLPWAPDVPDTVPFRFDLVDTGETVTREREILRHDGTRILIEMRSKKMPGGGYQSILRDITARRNTELALREKDALIASIGNSLPECMLYQIIRKPDGRRMFTFVSETVRTFFGCSPEEAMADPMRIYGRVFEEDQARLTETEERAFQDFSVFKAEARILAPNGEIRWSWFCSQPRKLQDGSTCWDGIEMDVTARKLAELELARSRTDLAEANSRLEQQLRFTEALMRSIPIPVFYKDREGRYLGCNREFSELMGVSADEIRGKTVFELWPSDMAEVYHRADLDLMESPRHQEYEAHVRDRTGRVRDVVFSKDVFRDVDDRVAGIVGTYMDVTERKQMEERLRLREKMDAVGQLAGGIAHDFNNHLPGIIGAAEMLSIRIDDNYLARYLESIRVSAFRAADLTRQLLAFSRKGRNITIPFDVHGIVGEVVSILRHSIDRKIEIRQHLDAGRSTVSGDPTQIQNAILNLALNARDAMPEGGEILFVTRVTPLADHEIDVDIRAGTYLEIQVADSGHGMTEDVKKHLFEPFFTTKEQGRGTGLGLASVFGSVKAHLGAVACESEAGKGTTFHLYLPLAEAENGIGAIDADHVVDQPSATRARIMIVDDEPVVRETVAEMLREIGHGVVAACGDGEEAVSVYREQWRSIDLVVLDMVMPKMDGRDAFLAMRRINPGVRAILSSGYSIDGKIQAALNDGVSGFVQKPFRIADLRIKIADALETASNLHSTISVAK
jgi:PAS domain S-box-containing protein